LSQAQKRAAAAEEGCHRCGSRQLSVQGCHSSRWQQIWGADSWKQATRKILWTARSEQGCHRCHRKQQDIWQFGDSLRVVAKYLRVVTGADLKVVVTAVTAEKEGCHKCVTALFRS